MLTQHPDALLILLVEDEDSHIELIKRSFDVLPERYRLEVACTIHGARVFIASRMPQLILTDYRLPDGDGKELIHLADGSCPVVLMTSQGNEQIAVEAMKAGAQDYIVKSPEIFSAMPRIVDLALREWELVQKSRQLHEAVSRGKREWEQTFDAVPDLISIIDLNHTILRVNRAMADRCGFKPEELIGRRCYELMHGLTEPASFCPHALMMRDGRNHQGEFEEKRLNGFFGVTVSPLYDNEGRVTACVHVARDITKKKMAEEELNLFFNLVPDMVCIASTDGYFKKINKAWETTLGYSQEEMLSMPLLDFVHPDDRDNTLCEIAKQTAGESTENFVNRYRCKDGSYRLLEWLSTPAIKETLLFAAARDITERKRAEEERYEMEQKYQQTQKLESLGVLAGGIAHDFNNILTIILGRCHMINNGINSGTDQATHVNQIEKAAGRAADLCRQMLTYAGKSALVQTRINLWLLVDENVKMLRSAIKKNVRIELDSRYYLFEITGDSAQMQQVVMNLIINAAEAIGDKNGTVKIVFKKMTIQAEQGDRDFLGNMIQTGSYICLEVSDNGCGMDVETQKRIFEPFYTTKFTGRGLGMSAVLGIVKSHGGALQLLSTPGDGTTFKVYFPLSAVPDIFEAAPVAGQLPSLKGNDAILLVDDEESLRIIGSALLKAMGFSVMTAANGREALEIYREQESGIDLILLDEIMPEMGGLDTYRMLREISPTIPIVICSGQAVDWISGEFDNDHHATVIQKPYKPDQLRNTLMELLDKNGSYK